MQTLISSCLLSVASDGSTLFVRSIFSNFLCNYSIDKRSIRKKKNIITFWLVKSAFSRDSMNCKCSDIPADMYIYL